MAMFSHRLRRVLLTATSSFNRSISLSSPASLAPPPSDFPSLSTVLQRSVLGRSSEVSRIPVRLYSTGKYKLYKEGDEITEDTVLFEGCDYNHWLITMDFPKDNPLSPEEMVSTYEHTCAKGLGISLEEAKQKIYACSTTTYQGFQAIMTEQESEKFKDLPGVVFILPDSYIDPVNKEYGGDKYENGVITHRPPPIQMNRSRSRDRVNPRFDRQGGGGGPQNFQRNPGYGQQQPPMQSGGGNYGPPPQSYGPPGQGQGTQGPPQSYGPPGQGQRTQGPPPPFQGGYNQGPRSPPPPPFQGGYNQGPGSPVPPPFQGTPGGYGQSGAGNFSQGPQGGYNQGGPRNYSPQGSGNYGPPPGAGNPGYGQGGFTGAGQPHNPTIPQADQRIPEWNNNNPAGQPGSDQFPQGRRY